MAEAEYVEVLIYKHHGPIPETSTVNGLHRHSSPQAQNPLSAQHQCTPSHGSNSRNFAAPNILRFQQREDKHTTKQSAKDMNCTRTHSIKRSPVPSNCPVCIRSRLRLSRPFMSCRHINVTSTLAQSLMLESLNCIYFTFGTTSRWRPIWRFC